MGSAIVPDKGWVIYGYQEPSSEEEEEEEEDDNEDEDEALEEVEDEVVALVSNLQILAQPNGTWIKGPSSRSSHGECVLQVPGNFFGSHTSHLYPCLPIDGLARISKIILSTFLNTLEPHFNLFWVLLRVS